MYRDRGGGGSKSEVVVGAVDRKRINDALDKQLERSSPSTSRTNINGKDMSVLMNKHANDHHQRDSRSASLPKNNASDGIDSLMRVYLLSFEFYISSFIFCY